MDADRSTIFVVDMDRNTFRYVVFKLDQHSAMIHSVLHDQLAMLLMR